MGTGGEQVRGISRLIPSSESGLDSGDGAMRPTLHAVSRTAAVVSFPSPSPTSLTTITDVKPKPIGMARTTTIDTTGPARVGITYATSKLSSATRVKQLSQGILLIITISIRPVRDSRGKLVEGVMTIRDVTDMGGGGGGSE